MHAAYTLHACGPTCTAPLQALHQPLHFSLGSRWGRWCTVAGVMVHPCSIILTCMHLVARGASGPMSSRMLGRHKSVSVRRSACAWPRLCYRHACAHGLRPYQRVPSGYRTRPAWGCRPAGPRTARARAQDLAAWYLGVIGSVLSEFQAHVVFCQIKWTQSQLQSVLVSSIFRFVWAMRW